MIGSDPSPDDRERGRSSPDDREYVHSSPGGTGVATIDGRRIAYRRAGTAGPPVVLLHGGGVDDATLSWRHVIPALAEDRRVYAPDWPGYGDSDDVETHSVDAYVDLLGRFLAAVGLDSEPVALVGLSMGGAAALGYALAHPDRVERLALVDSYGLGERIPAGSFWKATAHVPGANTLGWSAAGVSDATARAALDAVVKDASTLSPEFVSAFRSRASAPRAGSAFERFQRNELAADGRARTNYADDLDGFDVPTLLVHGADDPLFPVEWSRRAAERLPEATLSVYEDCGHWVPRERPDAFVDRLRSFLYPSEREKA